MYPQLGQDAIVEKYIKHVVQQLYDGRRSRQGKRSCRHGLVRRRTSVDGTFGHVVSSMNRGTSARWIVEPGRDDTVGYNRGGQ